MFKKILVPTDGSEFAERAVDAAIQLAGEHAASLVLVNVQMPFTLVAAEVPVGFFSSAENYDAEMGKRARQVLEQAKNKADAAGVPATIEGLMNEHPWAAIIETAESANCDLIVMASHGYRGLKGLVLGSQTQKVLTHSKVPVLVFR
ncbi:MAG: universal stress protein [Burkholderiaceae bacterium]